MNRECREDVWLYVKKIFTNTKRLSWAKCQEDVMWSYVKEDVLWSYVKGVMVKSIGCRVVKCQEEALWSNVKKMQFGYMSRGY